MKSENISDIISKFAMGGFFVFILIFVSLSSILYFKNSSNIEIKIQTDNEVNKEKTAINEALTKTLVLKNDTISLYKTEVRRKDSLSILKIKTIEKKLNQATHEKDSLVRVLRHFKQND